MKLEQNLINHVALVLDASASMGSHEANVVKVVNGLVEWLAKRSQELDQETRVSVYVFDNRTICNVFDKDVLRLPKNLYNLLGGTTALIDATVQSQQDLSKTAQMYGDHAFLTFVVTDGEENASREYDSAYLRRMLASQADNWTMGVLVPNLRAKIQAKDFGFPDGNIEVWDTNSITGAAEVGQKVQAATDAYLTDRAAGVRGSRTLFSGITVNNVTQAQVDASGMKAIDSDRFIIVPVVAVGDVQYVIPKKSITKGRPDGVKHVEIMPFVEATGRRYEVGKAFYELRKSEKFDYHKEIALIHRKTMKVYRGDQAKVIIGLTGSSTRIRPQETKGGEYDIFVQSQSVNRHLELGSRILLFK